MKANILFVTLVTIDSIYQKGLYTDLIRKFNSNGYNIFVVCPVERKYKKNTNLKIEENVKILQVKTLNIQKTNIFEKGISTLSIEFLFINAINSYFNNLSLDLILYSTPPITITNLISRLKTKYNAVTYLLLKDIFPQNAVDMGMIKEDSLLHKYFRYKEKELYELSDTIGCMSPRNIDYLRKNNPSLGTSKIEHNPNSIDLESDFKLNNNKDVNFNFPSDSTILLYGGNLGKPQGIDFLIEVLDSNKNSKDCYFVIVGDGTEFHKLNQWILKNTPNNVILKKTLPKEEYDKLVSCVDIGLIFLDHRFTIPNFPSRLLSYLESKLPILLATDVNTDLGEIAEINNFGLWSESRNIEAFNLNLKRLLSSSSLRKNMGENGYNYMVKNYSVDYSFKKIEEKVNVIQ